MTPLIRELIALDERLALDCMWFDIGTVPHYNFEWRKMTDARLPFVKCAIVGRDINNHKFLIIATQYASNQTILFISAWSLLPDRYIKTPLFMLHLAEGRVESTDDEEPITREQAAPIVGAIADFLAKTHPCGYRAEVKRNSILNRQRAAKGKPPIAYDWHTVAIEPPQPKSAPQGGHHASPRQHDRRGHFRNTRSGKRVFVRQCVVGKADRGAVFKDYQA